MGINPQEALRIFQQYTNKETVIEKRNQETVAFFKTLLTERDILNIYYPGSGTDFTLDQLFKPHQITYLDREPKRKDVIHGDFRSTPDFLDETFDAVFIQDLHQTKLGFSEILRTLKFSGLVVLGLYLCGNEPKDSMTFEDIANYKGLQPEKNYPTHPRFKIYKKG